MNIKRKESSTVALIAIAANESAYLAQFVFHHLHMGFSPIILISNNSEDSTATMAAQMAERIPNVQHIDGDPLRKEFPIKSFQVRAYQLALDLLDNSKERPDYAMFLDVDEFWVPLNGDRNVSDYIEQFSGPDTLMFNWVIPDSDMTSFSLPYNIDFWGVTLRSLKTIWRFDANRSWINAHNVYSTDFHKEIVISGEELEDRLKTLNAPKQPGSAMIVHQMYRSLVEYVAMLERGRPSDNLIFKTIRKGYRSPSKSNRLTNIRIRPFLLNHWRESFKDWLETLELTNFLIQGRINVVHRAARGLQKYEALSEEERKPYAAAFRFVDIEILRDDITRLLADPAERIYRIP